MALTAAAQARTQAQGMRLTRPTPIARPGSPQITAAAAVAIASTTPVATAEAARWRRIRAALVSGSSSRREGWSISWASGSIRSSAAMKRSGPGRMKSTGV